MRFSFYLSILDLDILRNSRLCDMMSFVIFENSQPLYLQILHVSNFLCSLLLGLQLNMKFFVSCSSLPAFCLSVLFFFSGCFLLLFFSHQLVMSSGMSNLQLYTFSQFIVCHCTCCMDLQIFWHCFYQKKASYSHSIEFGHA